jgi:hypothetical protein
VPLSAVVHPVLQEHCPFDPQLPFRQLQLEGALLTTGTKHLPVPEIPSSQDVQPAGHCWHVGPKKPAAQDSHDEPVNPVGQVHVPEAEHIPEAAQGVEHADDWTSRSERELELPVGSCAMSGTASHRTKRLFEPELTATQTLEERAIELADNGADEFEATTDGSGINPA